VSFPKFNEQMSGRPSSLKCPEATYASLVPTVYRIALVKCGSFRLPNLQGPPLGDSLALLWGDDAIPA